MRPVLLIDLLLTLLYWSWFLFGFMLFFSWGYLAAGLSGGNTEKRFQRLNSRFYQVFFRLVRLTAPGHTWRIDPEVKAIRSAVIVCNHISYLDPLLLIALFERQRTVVKTRFFALPVFGWFIRKSGYFPISKEKRYTGMLIRQMETMEDFLGAGGNFFIFPEGTRSRDGRIGELDQGAMKIARLCRAPIYVLRLTNTDRLYTPGTFLFKTRARNTISLEILARIQPDYGRQIPSAAELTQQVLAAYQMSKS